MKTKLFGYLKILITLAVTVLLAATVSAAELDVTVGGKNIMSDSSELVDGTTCLWFRDFMYKMTNGEADVWWDAETGTAYAEWRSLTVSAKEGDEYIVANGRYIMCGAKNHVIDGHMMVAVRPMAKAFGASVDWMAATNSVKVGEMTKILEGGDTYYDADTVYWLSRIISAEARGESMRGKLAVAAVIYNRVQSKDYPNTIYGVIFDMKNGVQFTPAMTGSVHEEPTEESVIAAKLSIEGYRYRRDILFFCANDIAETCWAGRNRLYIETIGGHTFFA